MTSDQRGAQAPGTIEEWLALDPGLWPYVPPLDVVRAFLAADSNNVWRLGPGMLAGALEAALEALDEVDPAPLPPLGALPDSLVAPIAEAVSADVALLVLASGVTMGQYEASRGRITGEIAARAAAAVAEALRPTAADLSLVSALGASLPVAGQLDDLLARLAPGLHAALAAQARGTAP